MMSVNYILEDFNNSNYFLNGVDFLKNIKIGKKIEKKKISMSFQLGTQQLSEVPYPEIKNTVINEINNKLLGIIYDKMLESTKLDYLDFLNKAIMHHDISSNICDYILSKNYNNIVTTGSVALYIQDSSRYHSAPQMPINNFTFYKVGTLGNTNIWINPFIKYTDTNIIFFNDVPFELNEKIKFSSKESTTLQEIDCSTEYTIGDIPSEVVYLNLPETSNETSLKIKSMKKKRNRKRVFNELLK